jgi:hypothetical protein
MVRDLVLPLKQDGHGKIESQEEHIDCGTRRPAKTKITRGMLNNFSTSTHKYPGENLIGFSARIIKSKK